MGRDNCPDDSGHHKQRGQAAKSGFLGIPEAPVYHPTEEEFKDPLVYIEKIRKEAEVYGICKIVPPKQWHPPFTIDRKTFTFPTKLQAIHHLQMRPAAHDADTFKLEYTRFLEKEGHAAENWPSFRGKDLDLCQFFSAVKRHGGYQKVTKDKKWGEVLQILDPSYMLTSQSESLQTMLSAMYETHLYDYEVYLSKLAGRKRNRNMADQDVKSTLRERKLRRLSSSECELSDGDNKEDIQMRVNQICEQCQSGVHEQSMLLCDRCDRGWHLYCLTPPLASAPPGSWYCFDCLASEKESFGFTTGQVHNFDSFRQAAKRFKNKWFGGRKDVSYAEVEEEFWSVVERCKGPVEVLYGSDLASEVYGSGFPRPSDRVPPSVDKHENIPGVTVPWVYMGMLFSSFCWHYEDQCFYSINYLHWGEPKCWYGVPGSAVDAFEQVMHKTFPDLFEAQPDLLFQLVTMLNPKVLRENDVPVCTTIQERGNFVITFPRSYHGGFNLGLNCAEAVNFATLDWLPFGRFGVERARLYHKAAVLSQEELLFVVAKNEQSYERSSSWVREELEEMISVERNQRMTLWQSGIVRSSKMLPRKLPDVVGTEEDPECVICKYCLFFSAVTCSCCPGRAVCLQHSEHLCECSKDQQHLLYRYSLAELDELQLQLDSCDSADDESGGKQRKGCRQSNAVVAAKRIKQAKSSAIAHTKLADTWCSKANALLCTTPKLLDVENLLREAEQFLWAGHEMDSVRLLEKRLRSVQSWAQGVVTCLASSGIKLEDKEENAGKALLATAQELLSVEPAPCALEKSVLKLKGLVESASSMQEELKILFSSRTCLELAELEGLQQKLSLSLFRFPEADKLDELVKTTYVWRKKVQRLFLEPRMCWISGQKNGTNMDTLHALQAEAGELFVLLPEKKILNAYVSKLEKWQERAKLLLETAVPLQVIEEFLSEVDSVPVYFKEAEILERRIYEINEWIRSAYKVIADVQQQKYYKSSMELLSALIRSGELLKIKVKEMDYVILEFKRVSWLERATKGLQSQLTTRELADLLKEARSLSLENEEVYVELCQVVEAAQEWEAKASHCLQDGAFMDDFRALRRGSSKIYATLSGWVGINLELMQAEAFLHHAQPFIDHASPHTDATLNFHALQDLISQSHSFKVNLPERRLLCDVFNNIESWRKKAVELINYAKHSLQGSDLISQFHLEVAVEEVNLNIIAGMNCSLTDLRCVVDEGKALGFELPEIETLRMLVAATEWSMKFSTMLLGRPSIEELGNYLKETESFRDCFCQLQQLHCAVSKAKDWSLKLRRTLHQQNCDLKCSVYDLEDLLFEAKDLGINVFSDVTYLEELLAFHKAWQKQISKCLHSSAQSISWEELHQLQNIGKTSQIRFDDAEVLENEVVKVETWLSKCLLKLLGESELPSMPLMEVLSKVQTSVDTSLQQLQKRAYIEGDDLCTEDGVCHLCKKFVDYVNNNHLKCDNCNDRYHRSCLALENYQEWTQSQFVCSFCNAFNAGVVWLDEDVLSKICITKRPTLTALQDLLEAAEGLRFRMKEVELLEDIIEGVQEWENCLQQLVDPILRSHSSQSFFSSSLLSALKIAGTMEVQGDEKCQLALALAVNAWRMHAKSIMESPTKPSYRTVCRILKEGLAIPFLTHDCVLKDLKTWETMASVWVSQAKMAVEDDGDMPLEDVFKLIMEGEKLPIAFTKELADLKARTSLYCICRKPYDKERGMIACDSCSEWYHFDCVGLPEPDSSDDECSDLLQRCGSAGEFLCPNCKDVELVDSSNLITELQDDICVPMKVDDIHEETLFPMKVDDVREETLYTPPLWYARGKRSSRVSVRVRADLQERWQNHSSILYCSKPLAKGADGQATIVSASGRPCRRTAGQNSRFESFVLLMHSG
ncbi:hypothetical protein GOP47_0014694 [Adiantum capillus-veneris]|uniref:Uncharacterized protein n=1 Tax=Adiantum capillus-veneris TaxID=13818 RepID=A0A9D4UMQ4_ADICA|nr:hypothetical protein GOP47_0014694 [Adiantum capillus-veneris]